MVVERMFKLISPTTYNVVRHQLYELINLPEDVRETILAENYIRSKPASPAAVLCASL
jgi:hypothetical protein